jgi:hypothetical protein
MSPFRLDPTSTCNRFHETPFPQKKFCGKFKFCNSGENMYHPKTADLNLHIRRFWIKFLEILALKGNKKKSKHAFDPFNILYVNSG